MKRFSRGRSASGQSVTTNGRTEYEEKAQVLRRKDSHDAQPPTSVPRSRSSVEKHLKSKRLSDYHFVADGWVEPFPSFPPPHYSQIPVPPEDNSNSDSNNVVPAQEPLPQRTAESPPSQSILRSDSPPKSLLTRGRKSSLSSTSTLFERSTTVPITIVVTTPDDAPAHEAAGGYFAGQSIRMSLNESSMASSAVNSASTLDHSRLMPPVDTQVDPRRMRKAREFEDIRHFLVGFLNTKGSQLPSRLRTRIMSVYGITDLDLDPTIVAKFGGEGADLDEGIVLDLGLHGSKPTDRDHMRILEMAFQSVLPGPAPNAAQDIMAARRKRTSMPFRDTASLHSVDSYSPVSARMSLAVNNKSKQTLDSIISNRSLLQSTRRPSNLAPANATVPAPLANPKPQSSSIFRRRSLQVQPSRSSSSSLSLVVPSQNNATTLSPEIPKKQRPRSLFRYTTDPTPTTISAPPLAPAMPTPALNYSSSKSRRMKAEPPPAIAISSHKPARSSRLSRSPVNASFPERPSSLVKEPQAPLLDLAPSKSKSDKKRKDQEVPMNSSDRPHTPTSYVPTRMREARPSAKSVISTRTLSPIPSPINITPPNAERPQILSPVPITPVPTHILTHKALTLSEVSDMEKPFRVRQRRSSSTLDAVSPRSPSLPPNTPSPSIGDEPEFVFPVHPAFAPLGNGKNRVVVRAGERRKHGSEQRVGGSTTTVVSERKGEERLKKKEKKEKKGSIFGSLKRSLFGRS